MRARLLVLTVAFVLTSSFACRADAIRYDMGEVKFYCAQVAVKDMNTGQEDKKIETFMLMYFPGSGIVQGADQFVAEYPQGSMRSSLRRADKLMASFSSQKGVKKYSGTVTIVERQSGDEYDNGKAPMALDKVPLSFEFTTVTEDGGRNKSLSYKGFCSVPKYEHVAGSGSAAPTLEPGCFMNNGEKFCK